MIRLTIPKISCGHCVRAVTNAVKEVDANANVVIDIAGKTADIESNAATADLMAKLAAAGYPATPA
jgi:copper chaperone